MAVLMVLSVVAHRCPVVAGKVATGVDVLMLVVHVPWVEVYWLGTVLNIIPLLPRPGVTFDVPGVVTRLRRLRRRSNCRGKQWKDKH
jgi:hypothetical protein